MQKRSLFYKLLPCLFTAYCLCGCQPSYQHQLPSAQNSISSQHVPTPLPIFPDQENTSLDNETEPPNKNLDEVWDVSDVDDHHINPNRKLIAFTFDDAPTRYLENILAVFAEFNESNPDCTASATLFINGCRCNEQSLILLSAALTLGLELGNHTYSHTDLTKLSISNTALEIDRVDQLLSTLDKKDRHLFRPPYGNISAKQKEILQTPIINWSVDTLDWTGIDEKSIYESVMQNKFPGAIVLLHDGAKNTVQALKRLLPDLKLCGYQVVSVSQMSKANNCPLKKGKEYIRARKSNQKKESSSFVEPSFCC